MLSYVEITKVGSKDQLKTLLLSVLESDRLLRFVSHLAHLSSVPQIAVIESSSHRGDSSHGVHLPVPQEAAAAQMEFEQLSIDEESASPTCETKPSPLREFLLLLLGHKKLSATADTRKSPMMVVMSSELLLVLRLPRDTLDPERSRYLHCMFRLPWIRRKSR